VVKEREEPKQSRNFYDMRVVHNNMHNVINYASLRILLARFCFWNFWQYVPLRFFVVGGQL